MARRKYTRKARRAGLQGQRWMTTSLSASARLLTATVTALELDAQSLPTSDDGLFDVANDEEALSQEHTADLETQSPNPSVCYYDSDTAEEEVDSEDGPADESTTVPNKSRCS